MDPFTNVITKDLKVKTLAELGFDDSLLTRNGDYLKIKSIEFGKSKGYMVKQEIGDTLILSGDTLMPLYNKAEKTEKYVKVSNIGYNTGFKGSIDIDSSINHKIYREVLGKNSLSDSLTDLSSRLSAILDSSEFYNGIYTVNSKDPDILLIARASGMIGTLKDEKIYLTGDPNITTLLPRKNIKIKKYYHLQNKYIDDINVFHIRLEKPAEIFLEDFSIVYLE